VTDCDITEENVVVHNDIYLTDIHAINCTVARLQSHIDIC